MLTASKRVRKPAPISIKIPDYPWIDEGFRGQMWKVSGLTGKENSNPKLAKSNLVGKYLSIGLSLAPAKLSGYQLCGNNSQGCTNACLFRSGYGQIYRNIPAGRIARSIALFEHRDWFEEMLAFELNQKLKKAKALGKKLVYRPNTLSDFPWEKVFPWMFWLPIQYYDYTKHDARVRRMLAGADWPSNYHLTFSRSEDNQIDCLDILGRGGNVAVVFRTKQLPAQFYGRPVFNGDKNDLRFLDPKNVIVGLYAKALAKTDTTGFVVDAN